MVVVTLMAGTWVLVVVVVVARFVNPIARIGGALFIGVLCILAMHVARLETLVLARGRTLLAARIVGASLVLATLTIVASTTSVVASHAAQPIGPALIRKMAELAVVALLQLMAHLALRVGSNFIELAARNKASAQTRVVDRLKILREQLRRLFAKLTARVDVLRSVRSVEGHVEPFHGETCGGLLKVALGEQFRHAQHLLPSMKMVEGFCGKRLPDVVVAARLQVDVLPVPWLLPVQSFLQKQLNCTAKVLLQQAIMLGGDHRCVDQLREVVVHDLLPGSLILPLEDVLKLLE
jgi:hypothetical protein